MDRTGVVLVRTGGALDRAGVAIQRTGDPPDGTGGAKEMSRHVHPLDPAAAHTAGPLIYLSRILAAISVLGMPLLWMRKSALRHCAV